jgi:general secretion pathway protein I
LSRRISAKDNGESGFTMIEAVVALALVMIVLAAIGSLVATNARGARALEQHVALMETARLIASGIPHSGEPLPNDLAGEVTGYRWQMRVSPFVGGDSVIPESRFLPQRIELRVQSPSGVIASFETVRLQHRDER